MGAGPQAESRITGKDADHGHRQRLGEDGLEVDRAVRALGGQVVQQVPGDALDLGAQVLQAAGRDGLRRLGPQPAVLGAVHGEHRAAGVDHADQWPGRVRFSADTTVASSSRSGYTPDQYGCMFQAALHVPISRNSRAVAW